MLTIFDFGVTDIRFHFVSFQGPDARYTVEYCPSLKTWYVFKEETREDCLFKKKVNYVPSKIEINIDAAEDILMEYLNSL